MPDLCPLCGQQLPTAFDQQTLHQKLEKLTSTAVMSATREERQKLQEDFETKLIAERDLARQLAEKSFRKDLFEAKRALELAKQESDLKVEKAKQFATAQAERRFKSDMDDLRRRLRDSERNRATEIARVKRDAADEARTTERLKQALEMSRLQNKIDDLNRQLERKSGEQFGEEGEWDLYKELVQQFPMDQIDRVGRGVKGADIVQTVMDGHRKAGRIVYESKNVAQWQNAFVTQAKKYRTQYATPYVMVVSRIIPKKQRGMCTVDEIPVVEPRLATTLAGVMREGILAVSKLRLSGEGADGKAQELYAYISSEEFQTRFLDVADAVESLRNMQNSARTWHENQWTKETTLHSRLESRHREISAKLQGIAKDGLGRKPMVMAMGRD